ncbi:hypothetical protein HK104_008702 [Borealophlyctis nickersoniae]|nr:hypothetical protein HK104_008702 [Borealophlyctis nickersoniae]
MADLCSSTIGHHLYTNIVNAGDEWGLMLAWELRRTWDNRDLVKFGEVLEKGVLRDSVLERERSWIHRSRTVTVAKEEVEKMVTRKFWEDAVLDDVEVMEFWCQAIGLTQKHAPVAMRKRIFKKLHGVLVKAEHHEAGRAVLLDAIRKGVLEWEGGKLSGKLKRLFEGNGDDEESGETDKESDATTELNFVSQYNPVASVVVLLDFIVPMLIEYPTGI